MERNLGGTDRTARIALGVLLTIAGMLIVSAGGGPETPASLKVLAGVLLVVGGVLFAVAGTQKCPVNAVLGRNTFREE